MRKTETRIFFENKRVFILPAPVRFLLLNRQNPVHDFQFLPIPLRFSTVFCGKLNFSQMVDFSGVFDDFTA